MEPTTNVTVGILPILCLTCTLSNDSYQEIAEMGLKHIRDSNPSALIITDDISLKETALPPVRRMMMPFDSSTIQVKLPSLRQGPSSPAQGVMSTLTSMVGGLVPYFLRPTEPVEAPPTKNVTDEKVVHLDHEHVNKPAEFLPDGVVSGGFYYIGQKANGEYFNEEAPPAVDLEVHSHDEVSSPGKLYGGKSEHPYYVVDKPAEGPAPPPLTYFTSGLRSDTVAAAAAWDDYYAKLSEYNALYRSGRATDATRGKHEAQGSVERVNQIAAPAATKSD